MKQSYMCPCPSLGAAHESLISDESDKPVFNACSGTKIKIVTIVIVCIFFLVLYNCNYEICTDMQ